MYAVDILIFGFWGDALEYFVNPKINQHWLFSGRSETEAKAQIPLLWWLFLWQPWCGSKKKEVFYSKRGCSWEENVYILGLPLNGGSRNSSIKHFGIIVNTWRCEVLLSQATGPSTSGRDLPHHLHLDSFDWTCQELNLGSFLCKADALPWSFSFPFTL